MPAVAEPDIEDNVSNAKLATFLAETRSIPVLALTALAMKGDAERIHSAGCDGYIAKLIAYREFLSTVGRFVPGVAP